MPSFDSGYSILFLGNMSTHSTLSRDRHSSEADAIGFDLCDPRLQSWLCRNGLERFVGLLSAHNYDLDDMLNLQLIDLLDIGVPKEEATILLSAASMYARSGAHEPSPRNANASAALSSVASIQSAEAPREPPPPRRRHPSAASRVRHTKETSVYANWVPPRVADMLDEGSQREQVYERMFVQKDAAGQTSLNVICRETQESVAVPEEMAQYILIGPVLDELQNELDAGAQTPRQSIYTVGMSTFANSGLSETVLEQLLDFLRKREDDELAAIEKSYARRAERIQAIITEKEKAKQGEAEDPYALGTPVQMDKYKRFFHGAINREKSEALLRRAGLLTGQYLVRQKEEKKNYVFSLTCKRGEIKHFLCERAMKTNGVLGRHFVFNKIVRLRGCSSLFDVLDELTKPPDLRMKDLAAHPPAFLKGVPTD